MKLSVLLVDDEVNITKILKKLIARARPDWTVETADCAETALVVLEHTSFDVVVSDMRMPGMDGAELLAQVFAASPHTVRIILSGHAEREARDRALCVAHEFLGKPCTRDDIIGCIERVLATLDAA